jgi:hypothetical protein
MQKFHAPPEFVEPLDPEANERVLPEQMDKRSVVAVEPSSNPPSGFRGIRRPSQAESLSNSSTSTDKDKGSLEDLADCAYNATGNGNSGTLSNQLGA